VAAGTLGHLATTACAAPTLLPLRRGNLDPDRTRDVLDRFARINAVRAAVLVFTWAATLSALTA
jgi:hypothetical protein